jgi:hypothetical protein
VLTGPERLAVLRVTYELEHRALLREEISAAVAVTI